MTSGNSGIAQARLLPVPAETRYVGPRPGGEPIEVMVVVRRRGGAPIECDVAAPACAESPNPWVTMRVARAVLPQWGLAGALAVHGGAMLFGWRR